jgi:hypothetical protein
MLLKMFDVLVVRGMETEIPVCVPRHEAELMAMIHGADGMRLRSEEPAGVLEFGDVRDERERLRLKYGLKAEDAYWVDALYPSDLSLSEMMQRGVAETEAEPKPGKRGGRKPAQAETEPEQPQQPVEVGGDEAAV